MAGEPFWDFGYPRNVSGELARDLKAAGLFEEVTEANYRTKYKTNGIPTSGCI